MQEIIDEPYNYIYKNCFDEGNVLEADEEGFTYMDWTSEEEVFRDWSSVKSTDFTHIERKE